MMISRVAASALSYFCAETSASFISRCEDYCIYLPREQRTSIRKVSLYQKLYHFLIVLQRRVSATTKPNDFARSLQSRQICFCHTIRYEDDKTVSYKTKLQFCFCFCRTIRYDLRSFLMVATKT